MGRDKALLPLFGGRLIESPARALTSVLTEWAVFGGDPADLAFLGRPVLPDADGGQGPLDGIAAALRYYAPRPVLVVACDLPFVRPRHLRWLLAEAASVPGSTVVASEDGRAQPLCGVYDGSAVEPVESALRAGRRGVMPLVESLGARVLEYDPASSDSPVESSGRWLSNVNSPADYDRASRRGERDGSPTGDPSPD